VRWFNLLAKYGSTVSFNTTTIEDKMVSFNTRNIPSNGLHAFYMRKKVMRNVA